MAQSRQEQEQILRLAARDAGIPATAIGDAARRGLTKFAGITITNYDAQDFMGRELKVTAPHFFPQEETAPPPAQAGPATGRPPLPRGDTAGLLTSWQHARERQRPQEYTMSFAERQEYERIKQRSDADALT